MLVVIEVLFISLSTLKFFWLWNLGVNLFGLSQLYIFFYTFAHSKFSLLLYLERGFFIKNSLN
jgi:hypothetical protein